MATWFDDLGDWWASLPPDWMFMMVLPFVVAAVGLAVHRPPGATRSRGKERGHGDGARRHRPRNSH